MTWLDGLFCSIGAAALISTAGCFLLQRAWQRRLLALKREIERISEDLLQMVDLQSDIYRRVNRNLSEVEAKVMDLSVPSADGPLPLERRHQVMTLSRNGSSSDEIARRLNMPKGEVELILSIRKYTDAKPQAERGPAAIKEYARVMS